MVQIEAVVVGAEAAEPVGVFGDTDESAVSALVAVVISLFEFFGVGFGDVEAVASREVGGVVVEAVVNSISRSLYSHRMTVFAHDDAGEDAVVIRWDGVGAAG